MYQSLHEYVLDKVMSLLSVSILEWFYLSRLQAIIERHLIPQDSECQPQKTTTDDRGKHEHQDPVRYVPADLVSSEVLVRNSSWIVLPYLVNLSSIH
jgi:hypothetical protein